MLDHAIRLLVAGFAQFAFPDDTNAPTHSLQIRHVASIPFDIFVDLLNPEIIIGVGPFEVSTLMPMPKTAMYEDGNFPGRKDQVRTAGQSSTTKPVPESSGMQCLANKQFRFGVLASDAGHHPAPCGFVYNVCHAV